jgi:hypothetical protein
VDPLYKEEPFNPLNRVSEILESPERPRLLHELEGHLQSLDQAVKRVIDVYYDSISESNDDYGKIIQLISQSAEKSNALRADMKTLEKDFTNRSAEIGTLHHQKKECDHMLAILDKIEFLRTVPDTLDTYLEKKHYVHYAELIAYSCELLLQEDLLAVGPCLSDLTSDLFERKYQIYETLVNELNERLYDPAGLPTSDTETTVSMSLARRREGGKTDLSRSPGASELSGSSGSQQRLSGGGGDPLSPRSASGGSDDTNVLLGPQLRYGDTPFLENLAVSYTAQPHAFLSYA